MRFTSYAALVATFALAGLAACGGDGPGDATGSTCPTTQSLTYENFGKQFFQSHCLACHSQTGPESPKLDTVEQIRASSGDIDRSAAAGPSGVNTYMPDGSAVDEAERRKLGEWLACGAP
jgi:mono/diheme cytochrome c family protein